MESWLAFFGLDSEVKPWLWRVNPKNLSFFGYRVAPSQGYLLLFDRSVQGK